MLLCITLCKVNLCSRPVFSLPPLSAGSWSLLGSGPHLQGRVPHTTGSPALAGLQCLWWCSCLSPVSLSGENAQALGGIRETGWGGGHRQPCERADQGGPHPEAISQERHDPGPPPLPGEPPIGHTQPCPVLPSPAAEPRPCHATPSPAAEPGPTQPLSHTLTQPRPNQLQSSAPPLSHSPSPTPSVPSPLPHSAQPRLALPTLARATPHLLPGVLLCGVNRPSPHTCPSLSQFNSMILYCVPKLRLMGQKFSVREKMDISDLQVGEPLPPICSPEKAQSRCRDTAL